MTDIVLVTVTMSAIVGQSHVEVVVSLKPVVGKGEVVDIAVGRIEVTFIDQPAVDDVSVGRLCIPLRGPSVLLDVSVILVALVEEVMVPGGMDEMVVAFGDIVIVPFSAVTVEPDIDCKPVRGLSSIVPSVLAVPSRGASVPVASDPPPEAEKAVKFMVCETFVKGKTEAEPDISPVAGMTLPHDPYPPVQFIWVEAPPVTKLPAPLIVDCATKIVVADPEIIVISFPLYIVVLASEDIFILDEEPKTVVTGLKTTSGAPVTTLALAELAVTLAPTPTETSADPDPANPV